jgi:hypothetical protein
MASSKTEICNMALAHLGLSKPIADVDTEQSSAARVCRVFYETARDATLADHSWPFATVTAELGLIEEEPNDEWAYSYAKPSDCLVPIRIVSGSRVETQDTRIPFKSATDSGSQLIYTDQEEAELEYISRVENVGIFSAAFSMALSCRLAAYIAPALTAGDPARLGQRAMQLYMSEISSAQTLASNESQPDQEADAEWVRARS